MISAAINLYFAERAEISDVIRKHGIRYFSRLTALSPMQVYRYCDNSGSHDAVAHYVLKAAVDAMKAGDRQDPLTPVRVKRRRPA
jgi:hypothetical protein